MAGIKIQYQHVFDAVTDGVYFLDRDMRISFWNKGAERITGYERDEVLGEQYCADVLKHVDGVGVRLCRSHKSPIQAALLNCHELTNTLYFQHKLGHRVPVKTQSAPLVDDCGNIIGTAQIFTEIMEEEEIKQMLEEYQKLALLDPLTEIGNRRLGVVQRHKMFGEHQRYGTPFGIAFIDIDNFKRFNDLYGHKTGDKVLRTVARTLVSNTRALDYVLRWGGEEFLSVLKNVNVQSLKHIIGKINRQLAGIGIIW